MQDYDRIIENLKNDFSGALDSNDQDAVSLIGHEIDLATRARALQRQTMQVAALLAGAVQELKDGKSPLGKLTTAQLELRRVIDKI